jgi:hypothetical protein
MANRHTPFAYAPPSKPDLPLRLYLTAGFAGVLAFALVAFAFHQIWS